MLMIEGFAEPYGVLSQLCCAVPKPPNDVDLKLAYLRALFEKIWHLVIAFGHMHDLPSHHLILRWNLGTSTGVWPGDRAEPRDIMLLSQRGLASMGQTEIIKGPLQMKNNRARALTTDSLHVVCSVPQYHSSSPHTAVYTTTGKWLPTQ